jgi:hypothetical protein
MRPPPGHHATMAQRYSEWARQQVDRANRTLNAKARNDRLALAEYYLQLAERELAAGVRGEGEHDGTGTPVRSASEMTPSHARSV